MWFLILSNRGTVDNRVNPKDENCFEIQIRKELHHVFTEKNDDSKKSIKCENF
jgi:hypothetical protein